MHTVCAHFCHLYLCRPDAIAVNDHRLRQVLHAGCIAAHRHGIGFVHVIARMRQRSEQGAVIGHEQHSLGVLIQPADRQDAHRTVFDELRHGL